MSDKPRLEQFGHVIHMPVRWGDMDALGHVNNACFFTYDESARISYFQPVIDADDGFWVRHGFILANIGCDFLSQLKPPADMAIGLRVTHMGTKSFRTESCVFVDEQPVAVVRAVIVWFDYAAQHTAPVPDHIRAHIESREVVPPQTK